MLELFDNLSANQANSFGLVLSSCGISHRVREGEGGWQVWVHEGDYEEALTTIDQYLEENRDSLPSDQPLYQEYHHRTFTGLWASAVLLACHVALTMGNDSRAFISTYGSSAVDILRGELYRPVTSLMIHASPLHLAGNMVGIGLFGTAVCTITGWGVGWLLILATGIVGNLVNAVLYKTGHLSVGASTAVFGAIGILAAYQFIKKYRLAGQRMKAWLPLGGGLALLGILGSGQHVDLMAHLLGFMAGIVLGSLYAVFVKRPASRTYQACCLLIGLGIVVMSWMRAFDI